MMNFKNIFPQSISRYIVLSSCYTITITTLYFHKQAEELLFLPDAMPVLLIEPKILHLIYISNSPIVKNL